MGEIIMRNWDREAFRVWVNCLFPIRQVLLLIRQVKTPIRGLLDVIRQVVPLISHIRLYPPYCSHLHPPSLFLILNSTIITEHKVMSSLDITQCHDHELTPSTAYTEYKAATNHCHTFLHSHDYELFNECSFSFWRASLHDQQPALHESFNVRIPLPHSHGC